MEEETPKEKLGKETESGYNLRERKPGKTSMGAKFTEDEVELIPYKDKIPVDNNMFHTEAGDGLYQGTYSISEGDSDEIMLLPTQFESDEKVVVEESSLTILSQVLLPFLVAGIGMVGAGLVLDSVQHWEVFLTLNELFIMVPALLGLKGNLEMTLASRLSTQANLGHLDSKETCTSLLVGNLALIQCQALVVGFLASVVAVFMDWVPRGNFLLSHAVLLCSSAMATASLASIILGLVMVAVILLSRRCKINPDNVATPIAASLGDLITLSLLSWIASALYSTEHTWVAPLIPAAYVLSMPLWVWLAARNNSTKEVLKTGWLPVIVAMFISSIGGIILDKTVAIYKGIAVYQPVINGVGGNLVAVQSSRISTSLHLSSTLGKLPKNKDKICIHPISAFFSNDEHSRTARVLLLLVIPGHVLFMFMIRYLKAGHTSLTPIFVLVYTIAALLQVIILLYVAQNIINLMWKYCIDPDSSAIPYLTAIGDLLGTAFLALAFHFLFIIGDRDADIGD